MKALMFFLLLLLQPSQRFDWDSLSKVKLLYKPKWPMGSGLNSGFLSMKWLGVLLLPPGWDASPSQGYPQHTCCYPFVHLGEEKHCESKVPCVHNTMTPTRARTRNTRSGVERTNHEAAAPPGFIKTFFT